MDPGISQTSTSFNRTQQYHSSLYSFPINQKSLVNEDYYNIDSILATSTSITCTFGPDTPHEFFPLIGQKAPEIITERGHRTNVPVWMMQAGIANYCKFTPPPAYNSVNREVVSAGAKSGNLEATRLIARQRHFYLLGMFICKYLDAEQARKIAETLLDAFTQRIGPIISRAVDIMSKPRDLLDEKEKLIFLALQRSERLQREWVRREHGHSQRRSSKRKFAAIAS